MSEKNIHWTFLLIRFNVAKRFALFNFVFVSLEILVYIQKIHLSHKVLSLDKFARKITKQKKQQHTVGDGSAWTMHTSCASNPSPEWIHDFSTEMSGGSEK